MKAGARAGDRAILPLIEKRQARPDERAVSNRIRVLPISRKDPNKAVRSTLAKSTRAPLETLRTIRKRLAKQVEKEAIALRISDSGIDTSAEQRQADFVESAW
jgi:hypothetical protein